MMRMFHPPELERSRERDRFDPIREGQRYGLSRDLSLAIWKRVSGDVTDIGQRNEQQAWKRFHELAARVAARGGRLRPAPGRLTRAGIETSSEWPGTWVADELMPPVPGRQTLVEVEARRWAKRETPTAGDTPTSMADEASALIPRTVDVELERHELRLAALQRSEPTGEAALRATSPHSSMSRLLDVVPRFDTTPPGRAGISAASPAVVMRSAQRVEIDPEAAKLVARAYRGGAPLDEALRRRLEAALATQLDGVRVHTDADANAAANALGARAFAIGDDVFFRDGAYDPQQRDGQRLIAHEVAHTVQARSAVAPSGGATTVSQPGDAHEREADAFADEFVRDLAVLPATAGLPHAGWDGMASAEGHDVRDVGSAGRLAPVTSRSAPVIALQQQSGSTSPLTDAVTAVRTLGPPRGSAMVTEQLVQGILQGEGEFLRMHPIDRLAESLGMASTIGPGQLGEPAISSVDASFASAAAQFATLHGAAPATWQAKATDANWSYFYIAAYLAYSINRAISVFHTSPPTLTDQQLGVVQLGIAMYHGAFEMIRDMRRRIASERGIIPGAVTWQMVGEEMRSRTATPDELELERYIQLAEGRWDMQFETTATILSRQFDVGSGGKLRVTLLARYPTPAASGTTRASTYTVELRRMEVACGPGGACGEGYNPIGSVATFTVGTPSSTEWTDLAPGTYQLYIRKDESPYSPDTLIGQGTVETIY